METTHCLLKCDSEFVFVIVDLIFCSASIVITKYLGIMPIAVPDVFFSHLIRKFTGDLCSETSFEDVFLFILFFFLSCSFPSGFFFSMFAFYS